MESIFFLIEDERIRLYKEWMKINRKRRLKPTLRAKTTVSTGRRG